MNRWILFVSSAAVSMACSSSADPVAEPADTGSDSVAPDTAVDSVADDSIVEETKVVDSSADETASDVEPEVETAPPDTGAVSPPSCSTPVAGTSAFATTLSGSGSSDAGVISGALSVYFPEGRVAGKPVVLSLGRHYPVGTAAVARGTLDASLSASGLMVNDPDCHDAVAGTLVGPADGMDALVTNNTSGPGTDALKLDSARMGLCPSGMPAAPSFTVAPVSVVPTAAIMVNGNVPLNPTTFATVTTTPVRPIVVAEDGTSIRITGKDAFDPFTETTIDLSGVRDVLGRPLGVSSTKTIALSASVTDPTFTTAPPAGASSGGTVTSGVLRAPSTYPGDRLILVLGLGNATTKTKVRLHHRFECGASSPGAASASLISEGGKVVAVTVPCSTTMVDTLVSLPTSGERWALSVTRFTYPSRPCNYPSASFVTAYEIDSFAFE